MSFSWKKRVRFLLQGHEDQHESPPFFEAAHGLAENRSLAAVPVPGTHGVSAQRRGGQQIPGLDGGTLRFRPDINPPGEGNLAAAAVHALLLERDSRIDTARTADDTGYAFVVGL